MSRYSDIRYIMGLPYRQAFDLLQKAYEKQIEDRAWQRWLQIYPHMVIPLPMCKEPPLEFLSFQDYLAKLRAPQISQRPAEEILAEAEEIRRKIAEKKATRGVSS